MKKSSRGLSVGVLGVVGSGLIIERGLRQGDGVQTAGLSKNWLAFGAMKSQVGDSVSVESVLGDCGASLATSSSVK
jgi:hypothetical protein